MKLSSVAFIRQVTVPGAGTAAEFDAREVALEYDPPSGMVRIGNDGQGVEVPREQVLQWKRDRTKEPPQVKAVCPHCSRQFNNKQALGGHLRQAHPNTAA